jgi:acyl carrier protein phosphodiesterase
MKDRYHTLKAVALVLRRMDKITEEMSKAGPLLGSLQYEWKNLETKYQELMRRLEELPYDGKKASPDNDPADSIRPLHAQVGG